MMLVQRSKDKVFQANERVSCADGHRAAHGPKRDATCRRKWEFMEKNNFTSKKQERNLFVIPMKINNI